jgi:hypothetical protein
MDDRQDQPDPELDLAAIDRDPDLNATLDRDTDLDELRNGGRSRTPGTRTTTGRTTLIGTATGRAGRAMTPNTRRPRPGAAPTTTGDATTGGMNTPTGMGTSDANSTGQVGGAPEAGGRARRARDRENPDDRG